LNKVITVEIFNYLEDIINGKIDLLIEQEDITIDLT
jgi:hypothetical protein